MRILLDTNALISAMLYPQGMAGLLARNAPDTHELYISDYNISELHDVAERKFPHLVSGVDAFISGLSYELVIAPISPEKLISDPKDAPVLNAAIAADVDVIISNDKHFKELTIKRPRVMTASEFMTLENI